MLKRSLLYLTFCCTIFALSAQSSELVAGDRIAALPAELLLFHDGSQNEMVVRYAYLEDEAPHILSSNLYAEPLIAPSLQVLDLKGNLIFAGYAFGEQCDSTAAPFNHYYNGYFSSLNYLCGEIRLDATGLTDGVYSAIMYLNNRKVYTKTYFRVD